MKTALTKVQKDRAKVGPMALRMETDFETKSAVYPLAPLQEGMLFHSLYAGQSGVDVAQLICDWREEVNEPAFSQAWRQVAKRHSILRTSFSWEGLESPRQQL